MAACYDMPSDEDILSRRHSDLIIWVHLRWVHDVHQPSSTLPAIHGYDGVVWELGSAIYTNRDAVGSSNLPEWPRVE